MRCPNCGERNTDTISKTGETAHIRCPQCLTESRIVDKQARAARLAAEAAAASEEHIGKKVQDALEQHGDSSERVAKECWNVALELAASGSSSSGFLISADGLAITNAHCVRDGETGRLYTDTRGRVAGGEWAPFDVLHVFGANATPDDIAVIKFRRIPRGAVIARLGDGSALNNGSKVFAIGNGLGRGTNISDGIVSDKNRGGLIMHTAEINPGNSGGPLFNSQGLVIGANVSVAIDAKGAAAAGMKNAVPINHITRLLGSVNISCK